MPIMASQGRSDARGTAQLLASMALDCIANPEIARDQKVALNNVYRLLELYRVNPFFGSEPPVQQPVRGVSQRLSLRRPVERHVNEVRNALESARLAVFGDRGKDDAMKTIGTVLRAMAYPEVKIDISSNDHEMTTRFFQALVQSLRVE